jgi:hypothetical protein
VDIDRLAEGRYDDDLIDVGVPNKVVGLLSEASSIDDDTPELG